MSHQVALAFLCAVCMASPSVEANPFGVVNLVTDDQSANAARLTDPALVNPWGLSHGPGSPFWVSNNGSGTSTLYSVNPASNAVTKVALTVAMSGAGNVTGQTFVNGGPAFNGDPFVFVSEDGTIAGWRSALGTSTETLVIGDPGNAYKGVATANVGADSYLYAANFTSGRIDVLKGSQNAPNLSGTFTDPGLPSGYAPFNIANLAGSLYVTYAVRGADGDDVAGAGNGIVDQFDPQGQFVRRLATGGDLNSPWGLAIAPASFGKFAGSLLVGNFGDGHITAIDPAAALSLGQLSDIGGNPLAIEGLWGLLVGNDGNGGSSQKVYFTAGPGDERHGLFGVISSVPLAPAWWFLGTALGVLALNHRRRR